MVERLSIHNDDRQYGEDREQWMRDLAYEYRRQEYLDRKAEYMDNECTPENYDDYECRHCANRDYCRKECEDANV